MSGDIISGGVSDIKHIKLSRKSHAEEGATNVPLEKQEGSLEIKDAIVAVQDIRESSTVGDAPNLNAGKKKRRKPFKLRKCFRKIIEGRSFQDQSACLNSNMCLVGSGNIISTTDSDIAKVTFSQKSHSEEERTKLSPDKQEMSLEMNGETDGMQDIRKDSTVGDTSDLSLGRTNRKKHKRRRKSLGDTDADSNLQDQTANLNSNMCLKASGNIISTTDSDMAKVTLCQPSHVDEERTQVPLSTLERSLERKGAIDAMQDTRKNSAVGDTSDLSLGKINRKKHKKRCKSLGNNDAVSDLEDQTACLNGNMCFKASGHITSTAGSDIAQVTLSRPSAAEEERTQVPMDKQERSLKMDAVTDGMQDIKKDSTVADTSDLSLGRTNRKKRKRRDKSLDNTDADSNLQDQTANLNSNMCLEASGNIISTTDSDVANVTLRRPSHADEERTQVPLNTLERSLELNGAVDAMQDIRKNTAVGDTSDLSLGKINTKKKRKKRCKSLGNNGAVSDLQDQAACLNGNMCFKASRNVTSTAGSDIAQVTLSRPSPAEEQRTQVPMDKQKRSLKMDAATDAMQDIRKDSTVADTSDLNLGRKNRKKRKRCDKSLGNTDADSNLQDQTANLNSNMCLEASGDIFSTTGSDITQVSLSRKSPSEEDMTLVRLDKQERSLEMDGAIDAMQYNRKNADLSLVRTKSLTEIPRKKLLILDVNGLLVDIVASSHKPYRAHFKLAKKSVFRRPFCADFLQFCFKNFNVGIWSSRTKYYLEKLLNFLMRDSKPQLLFCWDQSYCRNTGFFAPGKTRKPLFLKELIKLWNKDAPGLPWKKGHYDESNTILLDDSPYKALCNPPYTAIFPPPYRYNDREDNSLGPGGDLRVYLEGLAMAKNVQKYIEQNPFGQSVLTEADPSWNYFSKVQADVFKKRLEKSCL